MATQRVPRRRKTARRSRGGLAGLVDAVAPSQASERLTNAKASAVVVGLVAATTSLLAGAYLLSRKAVAAAAAENQHQAATVQAGTMYTPAYWANRLRAAFNPSGNEMLRSLDFTDNTGVANVARGMRTQQQFIEVSKAYLILTKRNVVDDMRDEMSPAEIQDFYKILNKKPKK